VNPYVPADGPAEFGEPLRKRPDPHRRVRIVCSQAHQRTDPPHSLRLLRARHKRPSGRAAEQRDELAPLHSITSSARPSSVIGKVRPSVLAVFRLITNTTFVDCITGSSAGFSPLRMRPV